MDRAPGGGAYTVGVNGTLGGSGTIGTNNGNVTILGTLSPGNSPDTMEFDLGTGTLDISAASDLVFELGTNSDLVRLVTGSLTLGSGSIGFSDFSFSDAGGLSNGTYVLFESSSIFGSLDAADLTGGIGQYTGSLGMNGSQVFLTVVPEPSTLMLGLLGSLSLFRRRRH